METHQNGNKHRSEQRQTTIETESIVHGTNTKNVENRTQKCELM